MTTQTKAVAAAQQLIGFMQTLQSLRAQGDEFLKEYNSETYSAAWAAMATAAPNPDGSLGAVDASPNPAHPITVGSIFRPANALTAGVTLVQQLQNLFGGQAVAAAQYSQTLDDLVS